MAGNTEFVAFGVSKVGAVVMGVVLRAQARWAFALGAGHKGAGMDGAHLLTAGCEKRHHLAIAWLVKLAVKRLADNEQGPAATRHLPGGPGFIWIAEPFLQPQRGQNRPIKAQGPIKVTNAGKQV